MGRRGPPPDPMSGRTRRGLNSLSGRRTLPLRFADLGKAEMPDFLSPEVVKLWKQYAPELEKRKLLDELSAPLFAGLCQQTATVRELNEILRRDGMVITGRGGRQVPHPAFAALRSSQKICLQLMREFGMTPASRARLGIVTSAESETEEDREFLEFLDGPRGNRDK